MHLKAIHEISGPRWPHLGSVGNCSSGEELLEPRHQALGPVILRPAKAEVALWELEWGSYVGCLAGYNFFQLFNVRFEVSTPFTKCLFVVLQHSNIRIKEGEQTLVIIFCSQAGIARSERQV